MSLAIARMHALAFAFHHGWAQKFNKYLPPVTMEEALAAHKAAQDADEDHKIVVPALAHTTGSGRTSWQIADDGAVTATISELNPSEDGEWGEYTLTERARLTVAPDGAHTLTQLEGCDIDDLDRACRVWRAVRNVIATPAPTEQDIVPEAEVVHRINRPWLADASAPESVTLVVNR